MKRRIKISSLLALLLFLFACQTEDIYVGSSDTHATKASKITFEQIHSDPLHNSVIQDLNVFEESIKRQKATAKLVYDSEYNYYIDKDNGIYIEKDNYHSYTFRIETAETGRKIENVVFSYNGTDYDVVKVRYDIENAEYGKLTDEELEQKHAEVSVYDKPTAKFSGYGCITVLKLTTHKPQEGNNTGIYIPDYDTLEVVSNDCFSFGSGAGGGSGGIGGRDGGGTGGTGGNSGGPGGGGSGSGGSGNPSPPLITTPIVRTPANENPCDGLTAMLDTQKLNLNTYISDLANKYQQGEINESSYSFKTSYGENDAIIYGNAYNEGGPTSVSVSAGSNYYAAIHLHPKNSAEAGGLFSYQDLKLLKYMYDHATSAHQQDNDVALLVLAPDPLSPSNYNVYAITVKNIVALTIAIELEWQSQKWMLYPVGNRRKQAIRRFYGQAYLTNKNNLVSFFYSSSVTMGYHYINWRIITGINLYCPLKIQ